MAHNAVSQELVRQLADCLRQSDQQQGSMAGSMWLRELIESYVSTQPMADPDPYDSKLSAL